MYTHTILTRCFHTEKLRLERRTCLAPNTRIPLSNGHIVTTPKFRRPRRLRTGASLDLETRSRDRVPSSFNKECDDRYTGCF